MFEIKPNVQPIFVHLPLSLIVLGGGFDESQERTLNTALS